LAIGACMRITDSLQQGLSHFYAEIKRLKQIVDLGQGSLPLLFLLDEILHGTNSHDRRIGAGALIHGLVNDRNLGLVTTHDLALSRIADELAPRASNVHFVDHLEGDRIVFDYVLQQGVVTRSNALQLMRAIGLDV
jgi:DNA mismatch repair ATPase MutS